MTIIINGQPRRTLSDFRLDLQALGYGTDTADAQNRALNRGQRRVCALRRWDFLEKQDISLNTAVGVPNYDLTTAYPDLDAVDAVRIETTAAGDYYDLTWMESQELRDYEHEDRDTGRPMYWTTINGQLRFYPNPDKIYIVRTDYKIIVPDMVADNDVSTIPAGHEDVFVWRAAIDMAAREKDLWSRIYHTQEYNASLAEMISAHAIKQKQTARQVRQSGVWDRYGSNTLARRGW